MAIKLVLCDMDGTIVPFGQDCVSDRTIHAIHALADAGIHFGPSSGREHAQLVEYFKGDESCVSTGILAGGKHVFVDGELVFRRLMPYDLLCELSRVLLDISGAVLYFYLPTDESGHGRPEFGTTGVTEEQLERLVAKSGRSFTGGNFPIPPEGISTTAILFDEAQIEADELHERLSAACPGLDFLRSAPQDFDVVEKGWSKLSALPVIEKHLGVSPDEVAYFGDSHNDLTMLRTLTNTFCPADGLEEAREAARYVIGACSDDGVAEVLESLAAHGGELVPSDWS